MLLTQCNKVRDNNWGHIAHMLLWIKLSAVKVPHVKSSLTGCYAGVEEPITRILAALPPQAVQSVLSLMSQRVPRTLEALLMHALPPAAAELLTQKLEQADAQGDRCSICLVMLAHLKLWCCMVGDYLHSDGII